MNRQAAKKAKIVWDYDMKVLLIALLPWWKIIRTSISFLLLGPLGGLGVKPLGPLGGLGVKPLGPLGGLGVKPLGPRD